MRGTVERLVPAEGFGFARGDDGNEYFLHATAMNATDFSELAEGAYIDFSVSDNATGDREDELPRAVNVRLAPGQLPALDNEPLPRDKTGPR
ncbi:MAG: cold shock domain-containing protein [Dehalococcoidia bacterium]|nr:cold shock domain-containing protein [Dehalococcoidia bacterium]